MVLACNLWSSADLRRFSLSAGVPTITLRASHSEPTIPALEKSPHQRAREGLRGCGLGEGVYREDRVGTHSGS